MTPRERNALVATHIFDWKPGPCDGDQGEQSNSSDGWFCLKCGEEGCWGDNFDHEEIPQRYTRSLDLTMQALEQAKQKVHIQVFILARYSEQFEMHLHYYPKQDDIFSVKHINSHCVQAERLPREICKLLLRALDVDLGTWEEEEEDDG